MSEKRSYQHTVLMGDPQHFSVKGGANPHTRTRWGTKRVVHRELAQVQWEFLRDLLRDFGVRTIVVPPEPEHPGLVYPANAGFLTEVDAQKPSAEKTFYLANLLPSRASERPHYERVLRAEGFRCERIPERYRFEGEADFFPAGDVYFLTYGRLETQRFVPHWGFPPWKRIYGFRTDRGVEEFLASLVAPKPIHAFELALEAHYHGDTALCAFGPGRRFLLAYRRALQPEGWERLRSLFGDALIELEEEDARRYAANSFALAKDSKSFLFLPAGVSEKLLGQIRERGVTPIPVDVSEFLKKGGGSVKCMIGDLGPTRGKNSAELPER